MAKKGKYLEIPVILYRMTVVVFWETGISDIAAFAKKHKCAISDTWITNAEETIKNASGACMPLGENNRDLLIWLKEKPKEARQYGVLYHELYHAVDFIADGTGLDTGLQGTESRAFLFEYLVTTCNRYFWSQKR